MTTKRLAVRNALVAKVAAVTGLPVRVNLDFALEDINLPCAVVRSGDDEADSPAQTLDGDSGQGVFEVHLLVRGDDPEALADGYEAPLRAALLADMTLSGAAVKVFYRSGGWEFDLGDLVVRKLAFGAWF